MATKRRIKKSKEINEMCSLLSNPNRLALIRLLSDGIPRSLSEIYQIGREIIGLTHRETMYHYLESLSQGDLLEKIGAKEGAIKYRLNVDQIVLLLKEMEP